MTDRNHYRPYGINQLEELGVLERIPADIQFEFRVVSTVLPFRVSRYVVDELIDWAKVPDDPVYKSVFPHKEMLPDAAFQQVADEIKKGGAKSRLASIATDIRNTLNPHPGGQTTDNVAYIDGVPLQGVQHKYEQTVLFFPAQAQICHSYCSFCFRWAQFVGKDMRIRASSDVLLHRYLERHHGVTDLLVTGGDPMVMKAKNLSQYLLPLCQPQYSHVKNIRIGSKALTFWPHRFVTDPDADELLRLFERLVSAGKHVAFMAHLNHWQEMSPPIFQQAVERIRRTGAVVRSQAPLLAHINDDAAIWSRMWREQVNLGIIPYYMFVERDTGAYRYFEVPLARTWQIYRDAVAQVSGLARTVRGPTMSCHPGKIEIQGTARVGGERVFVLRFIQAREPGWVQQPFFAKHDANITWFDQLEPAFGEESFFFSPVANQQQRMDLRVEHAPVRIDKETGAYYQRR